MEDVQVSNILKDYMKKKVDVRDEISNEELLRLVDIKQKEYFLNASQFDDLLQEEQLKEIEEELKKGADKI